MVARRIAVGKNRFYHSTRTAPFNHHAAAPRHAHRARELPACAVGDALLDLQFDAPEIALASDELAGADAVHVLLRKTHDGRAPAVDDETALLEVEIQIDMRPVGEDVKEKARRHVLLVAGVRAYRQGDAPNGGLGNVRRRVSERASRPHPVSLHIVVEVERGLPQHCLPAPLARGNVRHRHLWRQYFK